MTTIAALESLPGVDRHARLSPKDFSREYLNAGQPVVLTNILSQWKALGRWTPDFFQERFGDRLVNIDGEQRPLGPFIDDVLASSPENPAPYFRNEVLKAVFPEIADEIQPWPQQIPPNWLNRKFGPVEARILQRLCEGEIYIGGAGSSFPVMHYDYMHTHAFLMQLYGRKQYFLYAPNQAHLLYPFPNDSNRSQVDDIEEPDLERFPLFARARGYSFTLDAGETLFVPSGWWHTVRIVSPSITVSVNTANRTNWKALSTDFCRLHAQTRKRRFQLRAYLHLIGVMNRLRDFFG